jgi:hypothetical protein
MPVANCTILRRLTCRPTKAYEIKKRISIGQGQDALALRLNSIVCPG